MKIRFLVYEILSVSFYFILLFLLFKIMSDGGHIEWSVCEKLNKASFEDRSDTILDLLYSNILESCHFHVFAGFNNGSRRPSWIAKSHNVLKDSCADFSD